MNIIYCRLLLCSLLLLLCGIGVHAQRIYFSDTSNVWLASRIDYAAGYPRTSVFRYEARDTLVSWNGNSYSLIEKESGVQLLVRDDSVKQQVYMKPLAWNNSNFIYDVKDTNEFVYLDYSLKAGDSLIMPLVSRWNHADSISIHVIQHVDSIMLYGAWYKKMNILVYEPMGIHSVYTVVEGIGPLSGPDFEPLTANEWGPPLLYCFRNQGTIPPLYNPDCLNPLSITRIDQGKGYFQCYPNPAAAVLNIRLLQVPVQHYQARISDVTGKVWSTQMVMKETTVDLKPFSPGVYILQLFDKGVLLQSDRFFVLR